MTEIFFLQSALYLIKWLCVVITLVSINKITQIFFVM